MSRASVSPDSYTLPIILKAACQLFAIDIGRQLHSVAIRLGLQSNEYCESGLISLYAKSGEFNNAYKLFEENHERKLGSWNAIIGGLAQGGLAKEAIEMFLEMRRCGLEPDDVTMVSVTSACGNLGNLDLAIQLHKYVFHAKNFGKPDILMLNSLVDMYGKCGRMDLAGRVFSRIGQKNVSSWTSMIEGRYFFDMMRNVYGIMPQMQHYGCMVDLLGRVGLLKEAREIVEGMPMKPNVELEPWNDGVYVVLSNIYASRGLWQEVERIRVGMKRRKLAKIPAYSLATT
ncbi:hypothetical protein GH714_039060 [Hevea brasiliensis]|uniref:Pentatricopeptide repeat-containing protein n=1 Tax=Hevea brasiliensis TaxID=3981 RepID=A0A6A6K8Q7_HEVBR|nr:hypothetical protein GH714_039060 [Hevea brasiliensis]